MSKPDRSLASRLPRFLKPPAGGVARVFYWVLAVVIVALALHLMLAEKPWDPKLQRSIQKRETAGKPWTVDHCATVLSWAAAAINLVFAIGLLVTLRLWPKSVDQAARVRSKFSKPLLIGLVLAVLLGGFFRVQRLDHSLWSDEEYTVRTHIWGEMVEAEDGTLDYRPVSWRDTVFRNKVNNHYGYTIPTRVLHRAWAGVAATPERPFSEPVLRALPLLAGLASIALIGILVARYSGVACGIGAAFFLALNPWHLRYSVEARGYSQGLMFLILAFLFLIPALRDGRWRHWLLFAAAEFLALISLLGALYVLVITNAIAIALIFLQGRGAVPLAARVASAGRMLVANLLAAMLFIQLVLPAVPQIRDYLSNGPLAGHMHLSWWREVWSLFSSGLPQGSILPGEHLGSSFIAESAHLPGFHIFLLVVLPVLALIGLVGAIVRRSWLLVPVAATIGGGALSFVQNQLSGTSMHPWYVLYVLLGFVILIILGIHTTTSRFGRSRNVSVPLVASLVIVLALYATFTAPARHLLCRYDRQPIRAAVAAVRGEAAYAPDDGGILTASFGTSKGMITSYDPRAHVLKKPSDLRALIAEADDTGKRLLVYHCGHHRAASEDVKFLTILQNTGQFSEQKPSVRGLEELFTYRIHAYKGSKP